MNVLKSGDFNKEVLKRTRVCCDCKVWGREERARTGEMRELKGNGFRVLLMSFLHVAFCSSSSNGGQLLKPVEFPA